LGGVVFFSGMLIMAYNVIKTAAGQRALNSVPMPEIKPAPAG
jgi:cbb3-type cytochrome oxidase subunit 1